MMAKDKILVHYISALNFFFEILELNINGIEKGFELRKVRNPHE
jgi:hypothetical protein